MASVNFREEGLKRISAATDLHHSGNFEEALIHYKSGLELLTHAIKYETNPLLKSKLLERVKEWMEVAEEAKQELSKRPSK